MGLYRRFARSKKGMSTIFGALFFVILILMGFNVMLWGFVQLDAYNSVITKMSQRDQQAVSENIVPTNSTCDSTCKVGSGTLFVWVNNLGGSSVSIASVYLFNVNGTGICQPTPCVLSPASGTGNIPVGSVNFPVKVQGIAIGSYSYHIVLASTRGRLFSLYYPWRFSSLIINNSGKRPIRHKHRTSSDILRHKVVQLHPRQPDNLPSSLLHACQHFGRSLSQDCQHGHKLQRYSIDTDGASSTSVWRERFRTVRAWLHPLSKQHQSKY